tara:strand:+ start:222 stop:992 length:771 start_codon:yes stop_codon:yes gene_type:complete
MTQQIDPELVVQPEEQAEEPRAEETSEEVDWQSRAEAAEANLKKVENDLNSQRGRNRQTGETQQQLTAISDRLTAMESANQAVLRAFSSGDTDALPNELSAIQAQAAQTSATRSFENRYAEMTEQLQGAVRDEDGGPILDLYEAPELEQVRQEWMKHYKAKNVAGLASVITDATRITTKAERSNSRDTVESVRNEERAAARKLLEQAGIYDLDTGPDGGGAGLSDMDFLAAWGNDPGKYNSKEDSERATRILKNLA